MGDIRIIETGDGGDAVLIAQRGDLEIIDGFQNMPYLALFGGNLEAVTTNDEREADEQAFDWWGNRLLMLFTPSTQFNSLLEKKLQNISLTSSGRIDIVNTIKTDLKFMSDFAGVTVEAAIVSTDRIEIRIKIQQPNNLQSNEFTYIWDATKAELTMK